MLKGMGAACRRQFLRIKKGSFFATVLLFALFCNVILPVVPSYAESSSDLSLYDVTTNYYKANNKYKTVKIRGFIAGPASSSGSWPDLEDRVRVYGNDKLDGSFNFTLDWLHPITEENDPHYGMYEFKARGRPEFYGSEPYEYKIAVCAHLGDEAEMHCATKTFNSSSSRKPKGEVESFSLSSSELAMFGFGISEEDKDDSSKTCRTEAGLTGWIFCPLVEKISDGTVAFYEGVVSEHLNIAPKLFSHELGDSGEIIYESWGYVRTIANLLLIVAIVIMILSHVTGFGLNNYNIKKFLPKLLVGAILINFSYILCQAAIDLSNIVGNGIGGIFENLGDEIDASASIGVGAKSLLLIVGALMVALKAVMINPGIIFLIIGVLLAGLLAIFIMALTLGARQAAVVILVISSPLAIICYAIPGLKSLFNRWFMLFKAALVAYPVSSVFIYGSALGAKILGSAWGKTNALGYIAALAAAIVPLFFLPKMVIGALGQITQLTAKLQNNINGRRASLYNNSGVKKHMDYVQARNRAFDLAGLRMKRDGTLKRTLIGQITPAAMLSNARGDAIQQYRMTAEVKQMRDNDDYFDNRQYEAKIRALRQELDKLALTPEETQLRMRGLMDGVAGRGAGDFDAGSAKDRQAMIAALSSKLLSTKEGVEYLDDLLMNNSNFANIDNNESGSAMIVAAIAQGVSLKDLSSIDSKNLYLGSYLRKVKSDGVLGAGNYSDTELSPEVISRIGSNGWGRLSGSIQDRMIYGAGINPNSASTASLNQLMEEVGGNESMALNDPSAEAQNTASVSSINKAKDYTDSRNKAIDMRMTGLASMGASTIPNFSASYANEADYYLKAFDDAGIHGDLDGMEAAHRLFAQCSAKELSQIEARYGGNPDLCAKEMQKFQNEVFQKMEDSYQKLITPSRAADFGSLSAIDNRTMNEIRAATIQQVGLLRSRSSK